MASSARRPKLVGLVLALAALSPASSVFADDVGRDPVLRVPGMPPVTLPPGMQVFGPGQDAPGDAAGKRSSRSDADIYHQFGTVTPGGGARRQVEDHAEGQDFRGFAVGPGGVIIRPQQGAERRPAPAKKVLTPQEKQNEIRNALAPKPPLAVIRRRTLDDLFAKLAVAKDADEANGVASLIAAVWMRSSSDTANLLMERAQAAVTAQDYPLALSVLDKVVELQPGWAEAWNKRAAVRYLVGDLNGSMADVDHVLKLEPNHFLALNGLAMILQRTGFDKRALQVYRRELAIYPHQPEIEKIVEKLRLEVEGQGI